jgi:hypothetical protein
MSFFLWHFNGLLEFYMRDKGRYASEGSHEQKIRNTLKIGMLLNNHLKSNQSASRWFTAINVHAQKHPFTSSAPAFNFKLFAKPIQTQYNHFFFKLLQSTLQIKLNILCSNLVNFVT